MKAKFVGQKRDNWAPFAIRTGLRVCGTAAMPRRRIIGETMVRFQRTLLRLTEPRSDGFVHADLTRRAASPQRALERRSESSPAPRA
jgi:hypothetical protein